MALFARCTVCQHPRAKLVNERLRAGRTYMAVAKEFDLHKDAIRRHADARHPGVQMPGDEPPVSQRNPERVRELKLGDKRSPRERLEEVIHGLERQAVGGHYRVEVARELRIAYRELDEMARGSDPRAESYRDLEGWAELEAKIYEALAPYPEALEALSRATGGRTE